MLHDSVHVIGGDTRLCGLCELGRVRRGILFIHRCGLTVIRGPTRPMSVWVVAHVSCLRSFCKLFYFKRISAGRGRNGKEEAAQGD